MSAVSRPAVEVTQHQNKLLHCPKCQVHSENVGIHSNHSWCLCAYCTGYCSSNFASVQSLVPWYVCTICGPTQQRLAIKSNKRLLWHAKKFHSLPDPSCLPSPGPALEFPTADAVQEEGGPQPVTVDAEYTSDLFLSYLLSSQGEEISTINFSQLFQNRLMIPPHIGAVNTKKFTTQNRRNVEYFEREHLSTGYGAASIVSLAGDGTYLNSNQVTPEDALFGLVNAWFMDSLKPKQRVVYTALMHRLDSTTTATELLSNVLPNYTPHKKHHGLLVPRNAKETNTILLRGKQSIRENVARPTAHRLRNGYTYISFSESLACLLGARVNVEPLIGQAHPFFNENPASKLRFNASTPRGTEIQAAAAACYGLDALRGEGNAIPVLILPVFLWGDAFEPAATKQNRGSVQVFLATVGFEQDDAHSGATTFLLALGPKSSITDDVECLFHQELEKLSRDCGDANLYYYGKGKRVVRVYSQIYSIQQDRIERQDSTRIIAGGSNISARWGWLGLLSQVEEILPSCDYCYSCLLENINSLEHRSAAHCCADWTMEGLSFSPPTDYPLDVITCDPPKLPFRKNTFKSMSTACDICFTRVSQGSWSSKVGKVYLKTEGVVPAYGDMVVVAATNCYLLSRMNPTSERYRDKLRLSLEPDSTFPVEQPRKPWTWQYPSVCLTEHIDVVMHLLFLGIVATLLRESFFQWLRSNLMMTSLATVTKDPLTDIQNMNLGWCKVQTINASGTLGSSVSENFLAYCRLGKWVFGCSAILKQTDLVYKDPDIPPTRYTKGQIREWFKQREITVNQELDNDQIRQMFLSAMISPEGPPVIPEKGESGIERRVAHDLIECMVCLVAHVMIEGEVREDHCEAVLRHVKLFLGSFEHFDMHRRRKVASRSSTAKNRARWISKMNYISLLNLPGVMRRYGSLRALWEGDRKGEGGLPKFKAKVKSGTKGNWSGSAAAAVLCDLALERTIRAAAESVATDKNDPSVQQLVDASRLLTGEAAMAYSKDFLCYRDEEAAQAALGSGKPVSMVVLADGTYGIMIEKSISFVPVRIRNVEDRKEICGASYFKYEWEGMKDLVVSPSHWTKSMVEQRKSLAEKYVLLLPEIMDDDLPFSGHHYFITSNWEEMNRSGNIVRCQVSRARY